tara:strand:+ start:166174 stop:166572 length:399 start_codon:yes stop_codon:yes gene_type:complete
MPVIILKGKKREYMFSVVEANYKEMPEWGGIYLAVRADHNGLDIKNCIGIGSCSSFKKYEHKIHNFIQGKLCSHLYLLPEFKKQYRQLAVEDLMSTEAFADIYMQIIEEADESTNFSKAQDKQEDTKLNQTT